MNQARIPGVTDRVKAAITDAMVIVLLMFIAFKAFDSFEHATPLMRKVVFIIIVALYDPLLTSLLGGTLGHRAFKLRVKQDSNPKKNIWIPVALFRFAIKACLGWISILTVSSNSKGKAIHDMLAGSIIIYKE